MREEEEGGNTDNFRTYWSYWIALPSLNTREGAQFYSKVLSLLHSLMLCFVDSYGRPTPFWKETEECIEGGTEMRWEEGIGGEEGGEIVVWI